MILRIYGWFVGTGYFLELSIARCTLKPAPFNAHVDMISHSTRLFGSFNHLYVRYCSTSIPCNAQYKRQMHEYLQKDEMLFA